MPITVLYQLPAIEYDGLGRVSRVVNPDNTRRLFSYDGVGRTVRVENHNASNAVLTTETAAYDENSNLIASTDARQTTTTFGYDALNNPTSQAQPITATTAVSTSFGYDAAGNRTRFTDGRNNEFWTTYNSWGLPESQIEPATAAHPDLADRTWTAVYDVAARPVAQLAPGGVRIDNTYDDLHRLTGQTGSGAEAATTARSFGYDDAGRRSRRWRGSVWPPGSPSSTLAWTSPAPRVDSGTGRGPLAITSSRMGHLWDALGHAFEVLGFEAAAGGDEVFRALVLARIGQRR